jgi:hypothetical protein
MRGLRSRLVSLDIRLGSITSIAGAAGATLAMLSPPQQADTATYPVHRDAARSCVTIDPTVVLTQSNLPGDAAGN